jgi:hypothetical protein
MFCRQILFPLVLLGLASCSGSSKPSAALSSLRASSASTTAGVTATSTAVASTVAVSTVPPSTTSTAAARSLEVVVAEAAVQIWMVDREVCLSSVDTCDPTSFTPEGSVLRELMTKQVADYRQANLRSRVNTDDPSYMVIRGAVLDPDRTTAGVKACLWSTSIVFEPNEKAAGGEIVFDGTKSSFDVAFQMVLVGKRWLISNRTLTTEYQGFNSCPAK